MLVFLSEIEARPCRKRISISTHGNLILSRWSKESKDKRSLLSSTANDLPPWLQTGDLIEDRMKLVPLRQRQHTRKAQVVRHKTYTMKSI
jgi:hypothetical protein